MSEEKVWIALLLDRVRLELEPLCIDYDVENVCEAVLESMVEAFPAWLEGKRRRTIVAAILYLSLLIARGAKRGTLKSILSKTGATKPAVSEAVSRFVRVNWELGIVYLNTKLYTSLKKRLELSSHVIPYTMSDIIRTKLRTTFPGLFELLEILCRKNTGKDCISLLLEDPVKLRDIIMARYNIPLIVKRIAEKLLAPLVEELDIDASTSKLADLFINNPEELRKILRSAIKK